MNDDHTLMERILGRDETAFDALYHRFAQALTHHLRRIVRDVAAAEDMLQEVFLRVWTRTEQWSGQPLQRWLFRIATNLALNHIRAVQRRRQQPLEPRSADDEAEGSPDDDAAWMVDPTALSADTLLEQKELRDLLDRVVDSLPDDKREVVRMIYDAQMEISKVARELELPPGTVKSRLHYSRVQMSQRWRSFESEEEE